MQYFRITIVWSFVLFVLMIGPALVAQTAATVAGVPAPEAASPADVWGNGFMWAFASSWAMRWMREHPKLSAFSSRTSLRIQRLIGSGVAFVNGLGITYVFDPSAGTLVINGLMLSAVLAGVRQFMLQEFVYHSAIKRRSVTA